MESNSQRSCWEERSWDSVDIKKTAITRRKVEKRIKRAKLISKTWKEKDDWAKTQKNWLK